MASDYRVSQALTVRFMGAFIVFVGLLVFASTLLVALLELPMDVLSVIVILSAAAVVGMGFAASRLAVLVHLDEVGYQVRYLRGAGVKQARWSEVEDVVSGFASGQPVVVIRLRDGRTTTVPVNLLSGTPDAFALDLRDHLNKGKRR